MRETAVKRIYFFLEFLMLSEVYSLQFPCFVCQFLSYSLNQATIEAIHSKNTQICR